MYAQIEKSKGNKNKAKANYNVQKKDDVKQINGFVDNRDEAVLQKKVQVIMHSYPNSQVIQKKLTIKSKQLKASLPFLTFEQRGFISKDGGSRQTAVTPTIGKAVIQGKGISGEFIEPTPEENSTLEAIGNPLTSPEFIIKAKFELDEEGASYSCGEYRQYIKGAFKKGGKAQKHILAGGQLSEDEFIEDKQGKLFYGYRSGRSNAPSYFFDDEDCTKGNKLSGQYFRCFDTPKAAQDDDEMDLHFKGKLIDTQNKSVLAERNWNVYGAI